MYTKDFICKTNSVRKQFGICHAGLVQASKINILRDPETILKQVQHMVRGDRTFSLFNCKYNGIFTLL